MCERSCDTTGSSLGRCSAGEPTLACQTEGMSSPHSPLAAAVFLPAAAAAVLLFVGSRAPAGGPLFYTATFGSAMVYFMVGAVFGRGRLRGRPRRGWAEIGRGILIGSVLVAVFLLGALLVRRVPSLAMPVDGLLENSRRGVLWLTAVTTFVNGVGEELFFRRVVPDHLPVRSQPGRAILSLLLYVVVTAAMGVPLLAVAAVAVGAAAHWQAARTGGLLAPIALHTVWSQGMLLILPQLI